jgi:hypothetical protein
MAEYWIPKAIKSKSSLRRQLHVKTGENINPVVLEKIREQDVGTHVQTKGYKVPVTRKLKKRAVLALTLRKLQKKPRKI